MSLLFYLLLYLFIILFVIINASSELSDVSNTLKQFLKKNKPDETLRFFGTNIIENIIVILITAIKEKQRKISRPLKLFFKYRQLRISQ